MTANSRVETRYVIAAFAVHLVFQIHSVYFHGYWSQDFLKHKLYIKLASEAPWNYFRHYLPGTTNPPLYHLIGGLIRRFAGTADYLTDIGLLNAVLGFAGFCFAYGIIRRLIGSPLLRMAAITLILFLPFAMIHAEVIASDALSTPLFLFLLWLILRFDPRAGLGKFLFCAAGIALALVAAVFTKFMFGSFVMATGVWALALWWTGQLKGRRLAMLFFVITVIPGILAFREGVKYRSEGGYTYNLSIPKTMSDAAMNPRSLLWLLAEDIDILSAPAYNWMVGRSYNLLIENKHSFPALVHLAIFTDILNTYQYDPYDYYFGQRGKINHQRMQIAVRSGIVFSLLMVIAVIVLLFRSSIRVIRQDSRDLSVYAVMLFCMAWFVNIVLPLPFIPGAYMEGYWTPRLIAPALIGFFIVSFVFLDRQRWQSPRLNAAILAIVIAQSVIHASFLWPYQSGNRLYESNSDVWLDAYTKGAVFRVYDWQDGYNRNSEGVYWLGPTMGIVVDRAENGVPAEKWKLSFKVQRGPSDSSPRGVLRVSSLDSPPQLFEFDNVSEICTNIVLSPGRNDIRLDLVSPEPIETPEDTLIQLAKISDIKVTRDDGVEAPRIVP